MCQYVIYYIDLTALLEFRVRRLPDHQVPTSSHVRAGGEPEAIHGPEVIETDKVNSKL
jgi:hypothetical protein